MVKLRHQKLTTEFLSSYTPQNQWRCLRKTNDINHKKAIEEGMMAMARVKEAEEKAARAALMEHANK